MTDIQKNLQNVYFSKQNYVPGKRVFKNNLPVSDTFTKSDVSKTLSFGAGLKPSQTKQLAKAGKVISFCPPRANGTPVQKISEQETTSILSQLSKTAHGIKLKIAQLFSEFSLSSETRLKKTLARADFINATGLTQEQANEFLYSNLSAIILDKEEKDILSELYGLFEKPKQTLKKAAKERGISEEAVKSEQERILAKIKNYFAPGLTGGEKGFVEDLELETKGLSAQEIKTKIHKIIRDAGLNKKEKEIVIRTFSLFGKPGFKLDDGYDEIRKITDQLGDVLPKIQRSLLSPLRPHVLKSKQSEDFII